MMLFEMDMCQKYIDNLEEFENIRDDGMFLKYSLVEVLSFLFGCSIQ